MLLSSLLVFEKLRTRVAFYLGPLRVVRLSLIFASVDIGWIMLLVVMLLKSLFILEGFHAKLAKESFGVGIAMSSIYGFLLAKRL